MSLSAGGSTVAVAVHGVPGGRVGNGSRRAVRWAVENLLPRADRFLLVHVMPKIRFIPTPVGDRIPVSELDANVVSLYVHDMKEKFESVFSPFKMLCREATVETLVLEDDDPATALLRYISESGIKSLVLGSCSSNCITRKLKGPGVPTTVLRSAPDYSEVYVISRHRIIRRSANISSASETDSRQNFLGDHYHRECASDVNAPFSGTCSSVVESEVHKSIECPEGSETSIIQSLPSNLPRTTQVDVQAEVKLVQMELENTVSMYKHACEELVHAQTKVKSLSYECLEESRRVNAALEREEALRKVAAEEKVKHLEAMKALEEAKSLLAKEAYERQMAEVNALKLSLEKQKIVESLISSDKRYRRYTKDEIEIATDSFSEVNVIGQGGYGKVYKCNLDHTPVAVKVLQSERLEKKDEFLKEIEILSQIRHPNVVLLLGACPERGCLVYEYLENGSLDEYIPNQNGRPLLPWFVRFRILYQVACGLVFLHNSKPEPIVHRDLKPGNILLDKNYVSKIADVGMAKILGDVVPDNVTEYRNSVIAGTLHYMDPEYQRTGTIRPKSDLYAFGIIILQALAGRYPHGLLLAVENAIASGSLLDILDKSVNDWPLIETEELAQIALKCTKLRCRDRPDLEAEVLPVLKKLADIADASQKDEVNLANPPTHYFCPILQEIMDDPYIAADGFSYEYRAIKAWLNKHNVSPVTKLKLQHSVLTPNHTLRSAIKAWRSSVPESSSSSTTSQH